MSIKLESELISEEIVKLRKNIDDLKDKLKSIEISLCKCKSQLWNAAAKLSNHSEYETSTKCLSTAIELDESIERKQL